MTISTDPAASPEQMGPAKNSPLKRILLTLTLVIVLLIIGVMIAAYWAYRQQTALLISNANQLLQPYGIEVLDVHGLKTGLQQSRADSVEFRIQGQTAVQRIQVLTLDYEIQELIQGKFNQFSAQSVVLQLQHADLPDGADVALNTISVSCLAMDNCSGSATLQASVKQLSSASTGLQASGIAASSSLNFSFRAPVLRLNIEPGFESALTLARIPGDNTTMLDIEQLSMSSNQTWRFNLNTEEQLLVFDGGQLHVNAPVLRNQPGTDSAGLSGFELNVSRFNGSYDYSEPDDSTQWMSRLTAQTSLELLNVYTTLQPYNLWSYRWPINLYWDATQSFTSDISAVFNNRKIADVQIIQNFSNGQGSLKFSTETLEFSPAGDSLSRFISPLPLESNLLDGELSLASDIRWQRPQASTSANQDMSAWQPQGTVSVIAKDLAGLVDETIFTGLTTSATWNLQTDLSLVSREPALLQIQQLDLGLPLRNIRTRFHINTGNGVLALSSIRFDMFGGQAESDPFTVNLKQTDPLSEFGDRFELRLEGVDISQVLSLSAYNAVTATGLVGGTLPIRLQGLKPIIENGRLTARVPGGSIRYDGGTESGNQSLDLVYQALRHYRYETLSANVDYDDNGELNLAVQLQGVSPELNNGQRINLNLNISDNIPALLQSLQAAQGITDRLEELLQ
ncbi:MAG: YdbH domain-containing protein [Pseudohongiella sp.]|nr:YdbH domain-containing protein [Pseudohongiella sp.]